MFQALAEGDRERAMPAENREEARRRMRLNFTKAVAGKGCSTFALTDALVRSARASGLSGSSFRRRPGRNATCHARANPRFSSRFCTPKYPSIPPYLSFPAVEQSVGLGHVMDVG